MAVNLPPAPNNTPMVDRTGRIVREWTLWFELVFQRIGGKQAPSNSELVENLDVTGLQTDVAQLQADLDALEAGSLGVGPVL